MPRNNLRKHYLMFKNPLRPPTKSQFNYVQSSDETIYFVNVPDLK